MNTAFEQSENGTNYQMPGENPSVPDPDDSTESLTYSSVYDNQDSGPGSALYPRHPEHVSGSAAIFIFEVNQYASTNICCDNESHEKVYYLILLLSLWEILDKVIPSPCDDHNCNTVGIPEARAC
ncbi:hypothetical protein KUCAC02_021895 [Chaenocephalus aceratus]|uniref:Uncharacterized protein n=1 Tax=Chaenocephalus aceratus TaxID=36190 RepID=A0ACB9XIS9_CHAAC|nr:hypothetical protein KUCAC02_021895 [Chaenocephalus aceratus]